MAGFVPIFEGNEDNERIHKILKGKCVWGGSDKREEIDGLTWLGYEFTSLDAAMRWIKVAERE